MSTSRRIAVAHDEMVEHLLPGDRIVMGDGLVALQVDDRAGDTVRAHGAVGVACCRDDRA